MDGLDIDRVLGWKKEHGTVQGFPGAEDITNAELLETAVRHPDPGGATRTRSPPTTPATIKAKIVAEAANGPTTPEADEILAEHGVFMIPDILANAGGVTVSYFEWVQDLNRDHWTEAEVNAKLKVIMVKAFAEVLDAGPPQDVDMRTAAYLDAVQRVADATALRGLYP